MQVKVRLCQFRFVLGIIAFLPLTPSISYAQTKCVDIFSKISANYTKRGPEELLTKLGVRNDFRHEQEWEINLSTENTKSWSARVLGEDYKICKSLSSEPWYRSDLVYRGMSVTLHELRKLIKEGMSPIPHSKGSLAPSIIGISTSSFPESALGYIYQGIWYRPEVAQLAILMEVKRAAPFGQSPNYERSIIIPKDETDPATELIYNRIYPEQITRIFVLDIEMKDSPFPFQEFSVKELGRILENRP